MAGERRWISNPLPSDVVEDSDGGTVESRVPTLGLHLGKNSPWEKQQDSSRCDSGICDSGLSMSTCSSVRSSYADYADSMDETSLHEHLNALSIDSKPPAPRERTVLQRLPSVDEGFCSTDTRDTDSLRSSTGSKIVFPPELHSEEKTQEEISDKILEIFEQDEDGDTNLHMAIIQLDLAVALHMVSLCPDSCLLAIQNTLGQSPLHLAVLTKQAEVVRKLLIMGAPLEQRDRHGNTALHLACREGYLPCVQALTIPLSTTECAQAIYSVPVIPQNMELWNYEGETCLHLAVLKGHNHVISYLVGAPVQTNVNVKDGRSGRTVLHYAVESGNIHLVYFLIHYCRANVNAATFDGSTPLKLAVGRKFLQAANILRDCGADESVLLQSSSEDSDESDDDMFDDIAMGGQELAT